jgi:hypothetical protein
MGYHHFIKERAFSSAGERLPYKQEVGGSNPPTPTRVKGPVKVYIDLTGLCFYQERIYCDFQHISNAPSYP